ncbi:MAG TPA: galactokinase [Terriglobales bacterium]|jgi:galactokinase|nr:galactokinase [Terriglobales bacterium]
MTSAELARHFEDLFGSPPRIFRAPGRVNLLGEHTDYNEGFVLPCAIGFSTRVAIFPRPDRKLVIRSEEFSEQYEFDLDNLPSRAKGVWSDYVLGIAVMLRQMGHCTPGASLLVRGEVPIGAGLSSSAAIEVASALALMSLDGAPLPLPEVAKLCQRTENLFIGARVGIMDQFVSCLGKAGHALLLDCRSLEYKLIPIPDSLRLVICNTMVKHEHASGAYNRRREECDEGVKILAQWYPEIRALRDVSVEQLQRHAAQIPEVIYKRCLHVVSENDRVLAGAQYMTDGDVSRFGGLMRESHRSLRDLFEVSCRELDVMAEIAESLPGYCGGRMTGGGFGGCTVNLVKTGDAQKFAEQISERYNAALGIKPDVYVCSAANGASAS